MRTAGSAKACSTKPTRFLRYEDGTAHRSAANDAFVAKNGFVSRIHRKKPASRPMSPWVRRANSAKSRIRAGFEHVTIEQKGRM
jgi:hypothetical protein